MARIIGPDPANVQVSSVETVGTPIELAIADFRRTHCFAGIECFNDADGKIPATPTAGTVKVEAVSFVNPQTLEEASGSPIQVELTKRNQVGLAANPTLVKGTPANITGATHWRLRFTGNLY